MPVCGCKRSANQRKAPCFILTNPSILNNTNLKITSFKRTKLDFYSFEILTQIRISFDAEFQHDPEFTCWQPPAIINHYLETAGLAVEAASRYLDQQSVIPGRLVGNNSYKFGLKVSIAISKSTPPSPLVSDDRNRQIESPGPAAECQRV